MTDINTELILKTLNNSLRAYIVERDKLNQLIEATSKTIEAYNQVVLMTRGDNPNTTQTNEFTYDINLGWKEKIRAYMLHVKRAVTSKEIIEAVQKIEPNYTYEQLRNLISGNINILKGKKIIKGYKPTKMKGGYYALPSWFNAETNTILEMYKPKETGKAESWD